MLDLLLNPSVDESHNGNQGRELKGMILEILKLKCNFLNIYIYIYIYTNIFISIFFIINIYIYKCLLLIYIYIQYMNQVKPLTPDQNPCCLLGRVPCK